MVAAVDWRTLLADRRRPIIVVGVMLVLALVLEAGFYLGQYFAYSGMGARPKDYKAMQAQLIAVQNALKSRDDELAIQRTRHDVDRQALELVRKELAGQKEEIAGLEEGMAFYRSLISPGEIAPGLSLRGLELKAGEQSREYFYRIVVQQEARTHEQLKGSLSVVISGQKGGKPVKYSLADLSDDFKAGGDALQFRYFQSVEGELVLPDGFEPDTVRVNARTVSPHAFDIGEEYPWQLEERFTHVGK
jgi:predicted transcriptional regulator